MEKTYRWIVLIGLLVGLVINAVATFKLHAEMVDTQASVQQVVVDMKANVASFKTQTRELQKDVDEQLAEHERLIMDLERRINFQFDK